MNKNFLKKILTILDSEETNHITKNHLITTILLQLNNTNIKSFALEPYLDFLWQYQLIKETAYGIDLAPCATIFCKAKADSSLESLAFFCCIYKKHKDFFNTFTSSCSLQKYKNNLQPILSILQEIDLFIKSKNQIYICPKYTNLITTLIKEFNAYPNHLIPITLYCLFTKFLLSENSYIEYKYPSTSLINYQYLNTIIQHIPKKGIPLHRINTKYLQSFYKDTLYYECNHACVLCNIHLPHMLIASHIKPFRNCSHIYEAIDYNNGLLLCRNHDFLYDQGFITFTPEGILKKSLQFEDIPAFHLHNNFQLPPHLLTPERKLYLSYHNEYIFKDNNI